MRYRGCAPNCVDPDWNMKPMSPEDREIEEMRAEVSARYRAGADAEPSPRVDAAILEAARREASQPRRRRWHVPAAVAAVLVLGVSISLRVRDDFGTVPPAEAPPRSQAQLAQPAAPSLESAQSRMPEADEKQKAEAPSRPSRERRARADRESESRTTRQTPPDHAIARPAEPETGPAAPLAKEQPGSPRPAPEAPAPAPETSAFKKAVPEAATAGEPARPGRSAPAGDAQADRRAAVERKEESSMAGQVAPGSVAEWTRAIEELLRQGRHDEARQQYAEFRKRFPDEPTPKSLRGLEQEKAGR
jgi:hypothetical protein